MSVTLDIIVVNWNGGAFVRACLESVAASRRDGFDIQRVVVVDNASTDGSVQALDGLALPLQVIANRENRGFGAACNQGAAESKATYLLFLNPDTTVFPETFSQIFKAFGKEIPGDPEVVGVQLVDGAGTALRTCSRIPRLRHYVAMTLGLERLAPSGGWGHIMGEWDHRDSREVDHVMGAFYLIKRSAFEALEGFDERFFVYLEDLDLSVRARDRGMHIFYFAGARTYHRGGGVSQQARSARTFYALRSRLLFVFKHLHPLQASIVAGLTLMVEPITRSIYALATGDLSTASETVRAYGRLWRSLPGLVSGKERATS